VQDVERQRCLAAWGLVLALFALALDDFAQLTNERDDARLAVLRVLATQHDARVVPVDR
jgi:hypothetical protein